MFEFLSKTEILLLQVHYPDDIFVLIDSSIKNKDELLSFLSERLYSPYLNDNWDGLEDVLLDLSWLSVAHVRLVHYDLPSLSEQELNIYLSILQNIDSIWTNYEGVRKVRIYFHRKLIERVK